MPRDLTELTPGELWAYRHHSVGSVVCVEVLRLGSSKPPRVLVGYQGDEFEGREEWVPPGRLKVPWAEVEGWLERERQWAALREPSDSSRHSTEDHALSMLFGYLRDWDLARLLHNTNAGILEIPDVDALAADLELDRDLIMSDPVSLFEDGSLFVPWPVTQMVAEGLARRYADIVLQQNEAAEREARDHNRWGYMSGRDDHISAEICAEVDKEFRPARDLVRQWCGAEAQDQYDELAALRIEVVRLGKLMERAVGAVRVAGDSRTADALERELGIPLEVLRHTGEDGSRSIYGP